jgi:hypothetical protein
VRRAATGAGGAVVAQAAGRDGPGVCVGFCAEIAMIHVEEKKTESFPSLRHWSLFWYPR